MDTQREKLVAQAKSDIHNSNLSLREKAAKVQQVLQKEFIWQSLYDQYELKAYITAVFYKYAMRIDLRKNNEEVPGLLCTIKDQFFSYPNSASIFLDRANNAIKLFDLILPVQQQEIVNEKTVITAFQQEINPGPKVVMTLAKNEQSADVVIFR